MCQLSSAATPGLHTNPAISTNAIPGHTGLQSLLHTSLHHFRTLHLNRGRRMTLATPLPTLLKVVGWSRPILIFIEIFVWVAEYSAKKQMLSYQEVSIIWLVGFYAGQLCKLSPFLSTQKASPPLFDSGLKLDPPLCSSLLRHCKLIMFRKYRIGRNAVKL